MEKKTRQIRSLLGIRIAPDLHDPGERVNSNLPSFYHTPHWPPPVVRSMEFSLASPPLPYGYWFPSRFRFGLCGQYMRSQRYSCRITTSTSHVTGGGRALSDSCRVDVFVRHLPPPFFHKFLLLQLPPWSSRMCVIAPFDRVCGLLGRFLFSSFLLFLLSSQRAYTPFFFRCSHYAEISCSSSDES